MKQLTLLLICVCVLLTIEVIGQAETCSRPSPDVASKAADAVFIGNIVGEVQAPAALQNDDPTSGGPVVGYRIKVNRILKGSVGKTANVFTYLGKSPFSFPQGSKTPAQKDRTYLIYAHREKAFGNSLFTSWCQGSQDKWSAGYYLAFFGLGERLKEKPNVILKKKPTPPASMRAFKAFFTYVKRAKPDILDDKDAQKRWLAKKLIKSLVHFASLAGSPSGNPDYPRNSFFLGVWNQPTSYSIVDTRHYVYADRLNPNARRVMIDVLYQWGTEDTLDNQYPGIRNLRTFYFILEDGYWKLEDIYGVDDEFTSAESLLQYLRKAR